MQEYMETIGLGKDLDRRALREIFEIFDHDNNNTIDKIEMYDFINTLLSKKDEMIQICEKQHDHSLN